MKRKINVAFGKDDDGTWYYTVKGVSGYGHSINASSWGYRTKASAVRCYHKYKWQWT